MLLFVIYAGMKLVSFSNKDIFNLLNCNQIIPNIIIQLKNKINYHKYSTLYRKNNKIQNENK